MSELIYDRKPEPAWHARIGHGLAEALLVVPLHKRHPGPGKQQGGPGRDLLCQIHAMPAVGQVGHNSCGMRLAFLYLAYHMVLKGQADASQLRVLFIDVMARERRLDSSFPRAARG